MNGKQRREYWRKVERLRAQLDSKYFNATKDSILKQFKRFAKDIEVYGLDGAKSRLGLDLWEKELIKVFESLYKEAAVLFGNATYRAVKIEANRKGETFGFNREWTNALLDFLMKQGFVLVADITKTTKDKLLAIVTKGVEDGLGVDEIVKLILSDEQLAYAAFRARRIVRTEVMRASNMAAMKGAEAHGFEVDKMWISARDNRTRRIPEDEFDHWDMDGVVVPFNEPFTSTGKKGEPVVAMQPGDLQAPAGFTINCRCTVGFIPKRDANGNLIFKPKTSGVNLQPSINFQNAINQQITQTKPTTKEDIQKNIQNIFNTKTNLNIKSVNSSPDLTIEQLKRKEQQLEKLANTYKTSEAYDNRFQTTINFQSTNRAYGFIQTSKDGKTLYQANFGSKSAREIDRVFDPNFTGYRAKSRVDKDNLDIATTVHEYAHLIALRHQIKGYNAPEILVKYYKELRKLNNLYKKEIKQYISEGDNYKRNQISLGDYANTNIDEFMAESFTEYILSSNPSKYALEVGKLIDKYFKK